jgi:hypothetical protein
LAKTLKPKTFPSTVYSNLSPSPLPWEVDEDTGTISVLYGPLDATFKGDFSEEGQRFGGGWRPNPGADETVNVPLRHRRATREVSHDSFVRP